MAAVPSTALVTLCVLSVLSLVLHPAFAIPRSALVLSPLASRSLDSTSFHGVDDVGPAIANATQTALNHARDILSNYTSVLHGVAIPAGLAVTFFGYFLLAPVLFLAAFVTGGGASFIAVSSILDGAASAPSSAWAAIIAMLLGGALFGFLAMRALPLGMFAVGASLGVIFAYSIRTTLIADIYPKDPHTAFIATAVTLGLILGLLAVFFQKHMLIFSTAYAGACACVFGIGHFAGNFPTSDDLAGVSKGNVTGWFIGYLLATAVLGTAGMMFQFWLAADRPMPEYAPYDRRRRYPSRRRSHRYHETDNYDMDGWADDDDYVERMPLPPRGKRPEYKHARPPPYPEQQIVQPVYVVAQPQPQQILPAPAPAPAPVPASVQTQTTSSLSPVAAPVSTHPQYQAEGNGFADSNGTDDAPMEATSRTATPSPPQPTLLVDGKEIQPQAQKAHGNLFDDDVSVDPFFESANCRTKLGEVSIKGAESPTAVRTSSAVY